MRGLTIQVLIAVFILHANPASGQYYYYNDKYYGSDWVFEVGVTAGIMNSLTDIGGKKGIGKKFIKDLNWRMTKPSFGLYLIGMYRDAVGVRLEGTFGSIRSYDSVLKSVASSTFGRYERNLSFKSNITDAQLSLEIHPLFFRTYDENKAPKYSPYLVAGVGFFAFNPQAYLNGRWHNLHSLRTEGQGFAEYPERHTYSLTQVNVPVGLGLKYELGSFVNARLEFVYRILFTDYLDDASQKDYIDPALFNAYFNPAQASLAQQLYDRRISNKNNQRGNPNDNDAFFSIQLKIGMTIRTTRKRQ